MTDTVQNELEADYKAAQMRLKNAKYHIDYAKALAPGELKNKALESARESLRTTPAALPVGDEREALRGALGKFDHPGHRVWMLMHPDDKPHLQIIMDHAHRVADTTQVIRKLEEERDAAYHLLNHIHREVASLEDFDAASLMEEIEQTLNGTKVFDDNKFLNEKILELESLIQNIHQHYNPGARPFDIDAALHPETKEK